jgi:hypothetical protein
LILNIIAREKAWLDIRIIGATGRGSFAKRVVGCKPNRPTANE